MYTYTYICMHMYYIYVHTCIYKHHQVETGINISRFKICQYSRSNIELSVCLSLSLSISKGDWYVLTFYDVSCLLVSTQQHAGGWNLQVWSQTAFNHHIVQRKTIPTCSKHKLSGMPVLSILKLSLIQLQATSSQKGRYSNGFWMFQIDSNHISTWS